MNYSLFLVAIQEANKEDGDEDDERDEDKGFLDQSRWKVNRTMMSQAYRLLEEMGPTGLSQQELGKKMGEHVFAVWHRLTERK